MNLRGLRVTENYFDTLGVRIVRGRTFTPDEAYGRAELAAVIAYHVWQNQFYGDRGAVGRSVEVNGCPARVVGVTAAGFRGTEFAPHFEIGVPLEGYARVCASALERANFRLAPLEMIGRLAPHASISQARAEFETIGRRLQEEYPDMQRGRMPALSEYSATAFNPMQSMRARLFISCVY
jgi:hypothetical protein